LLASTTGGLDQSTTHGNRTPTSYICHGCLISSRGVIFPGSHREGASWVHQRRPKSTGHRHYLVGGDGRLTDLLYL
jgi:hypothetical protein